jgi:Uma2 family endonuclease
MTLASTESPSRNRLLEQQHLVMHGASWALYDRLLAEAGDRPLRITYDHGILEIMAPLAEHEFPKGAIRRLVEAMADEFDIAMTNLGSTTFRREDAEAGLEPDECFYLQNAPRVAGMKRFDPAIYPPPDLAIEIDITSRSVPREPIYAALGVRELWRFDGDQVTVFTLDRGVYHGVDRSPAFPFLPMQAFSGFVRRMVSEVQTPVVREFREWVRTLRESPDCPSSSAGTPET